MDEPAKLDQHVSCDQEDPQPSENEVPNCEENTASTNSEESDVDVHSVEENETESERKIELNWDFLHVSPWVDEAPVETETKNDAVKEKEKGNSFVKCGKWEDAIEAYSFAIKWDPTYTVCYANRAQCYLKIKWFQQAIRDCTIAITLDENYVKAYARRAIAYMNTDMQEDAVKDLKKVLTLDPENQECKKLMDKLMNVVEKTADSMSEEEKKNFANELKEKAKLCLEEGKLVDAINYYTQAKVYSEFDPVIRFNRAVCYFKLRQFRNTWLDCTTVIDLDENYVKAYYWRGKAKAMCNKFESAKEDLLKGLQLDPENKALKKMLETVESYEQKFREEQRKKEQGNKFDYRKKYGLLNALTNKKSIDDVMKEHDNVMERRNKVVKGHDEVMKGYYEEMKRHNKFVESMEKLMKEPLSLGNSNQVDVQYFESQSVQPCEKEALEVKPTTSYLRMGQYVLPVPFTFEKFAKGWNLLEPYPYRRLVYFLQIDAEQLPMKFNELCSNPSWLHEIMELMIKNCDCRSRLRFYDHLIGISQLEEFKKVFVDCSKEEKENVIKILAIVAANESDRDIQRLEEMYSCLLNSS